jgi:hypothetical protein
MVRDIADSQRYDEGHPMDIRPFHESDEPDVIALWAEVFGYTAAHYRPEAVIHQKLAVQRELFLVARLDGRLAGTVLGGYDGHRGWVYSLAVRPDLRLRAWDGRTRPIKMVLLAGRPPGPAAAWGRDGVDAAHGEGTGEPGLPEDQPPGPDDECGDGGVL